MRQMASSVHSPVYRALAERLWEHTAHVAALAHLLAVRFHRPGADAAMFAGIIHEVGGFYLISRTDVYPDLFADSSLLTPAAEAGVGRAVLAALAVPSEVVAAVEDLWQDAPPVFPPVTLGDLLFLANRLTPILSPLQRPEMQMPDIEPAGDALLAQILDQSGDEMVALTAALRY
jgi:hypothetical protein